MLLTQQAEANADADKAPKGGLVLPFPEQSRSDYIEPFFDTTATLGTTSTDLGIVELPAFGFLRELWIDVAATGGTGTAAVMKADAPWSVLGSIQLSDSNGQPIVGPITGYDLYLINLFGGYDFDADPTRSPSYTAPASSGNFRFLLRLPVEITARDGLGALANQNAASAYKLNIVVAPKGQVYSTDPSTVPGLRVKVAMGAWTPNAAGTLPPYLGTTQVWSKEAKNNNAAFQRLQLSRVGNAIRNLIVVTRDSSGVRIGTAWPDPATLKLDTKPLHQEAATLRAHLTAKRYGYTSIPTGVYVYDFTSDFDGHPGGELRTQWLRTSPATRLEFEGVFGAAGTTEILVNDVLSFAGVGAAGE